MTSSTLPTSATAVPAFVTPIIEAYATAIHPSVNFIMIMTVFASMLVPVLICLFYFSNAHMRRSTTFVIVVLVILNGLVLGIWNAHTEITAILSPFHSPSKGSVIGFTIVYAFTPWIVDLVLLIRLHAVYPYRTTPKPLFWSVFAFPLMIKIVRFVAVVLFVVNFERLVVGTGSAVITSVVIASQNTFHQLYTKIEWTAQIADNGYVSALFLAKLRFAAFRHGSDIGRETGSNTGSFASRLRTLFLIALTNFLFPVVFNMAQLLVLLTRGSDFLLASYVMAPNIYISILGVVFATVWSSISSSTSDSLKHRAQRSHHAGPLVFNCSDSCGTTVGATKSGRSEHVSELVNPSSKWGHEGASGDIYSLPAIAMGDTKTNRVG